MLGALLGICEQIDREVASPTEPFPTPEGIAADAVLYVKSHCAFSKAALVARDNLHLRQKLQVKNVSESAAARDELLAIASTDQAPCLVVGGRPNHESSEVIAYLVEQTLGPLM